MSLQAFTTECMKTSDGVGFGVSIQTNRTFYMFFEVFKNRLHHELQTKHSCEMCLRFRESLPRDAYYLKQPIRSLRDSSWSRNWYLQMSQFFIVSVSDSEKTWIQWAWNQNSVGSRDLGVKVQYLTVFMFKAFFQVDDQIDHTFSLSITLLIIEMTLTILTLNTWLSLVVSLQRCKDQAVFFLRWLCFNF